tara:strand:- start:3307 stop:4491 length:1185 start_codon:yes stop_codon:yes gene_type:complete
MKRIICLIIISGLYAQNSYDVLRPFWGFNHSQVLSNSIGGATVASGYVTPGLTSNPANLAAVPFAYLQMNLSNAEFNSNSSSISNTGFNGIDFVQPFPVYRGSFVVSAGAHKSKDYMLSYQLPGQSEESEDLALDYSEKGNLDSYHAGFAVEFAKGLYIGADFKVLSGDNEMTIHYDSDSTDYYNPNYSGVSLTLGMLHSISKFFQYGISIDMPTSMHVEEKFTYSNHLNPDNSYSGLSDYYVKKPITLHFGAAFLTNIFNIFYEAEHTDWSSLEFSSEGIYEEDLELPASVLINEEIRNKFNQTLSHHIGTAMRVPLIPLHLFAGYQYTPFPEANGHYGDDIREMYSLGFSLGVKQNISIQGSANTYSWKFNGLNETFNKFSIGVCINTIPGF